MHVAKSCKHSKKRSRGKCGSVAMVSTQSDRPCFMEKRIVRTAQPRGSSSCGAMARHSNKTIEEEDDDDEERNLVRSSEGDETDSLTTALGVA